MQKMMVKMSRFINKKTIWIRLASLLVCAVMLIALCPAIKTEAKGTATKTVRVGWYESSFNKIDEYGRRSGYGYDYQHKIAHYTGWEYVYVEGSWSELYEMLLNGEIDLLSDVTMTKEREEEMLFSLLPMGTEDYYMYVSTERSSLVADDLSTFSGKKLGLVPTATKKISW